MNFADWVDKELANNGWSRREAAKRAGISPSMFDKVINRYANPGMSFYKGIARAFKISLIDVLIHAGEIDPNDPTLASVNQKLVQLPEWQRQMVLKFIDSLLQEKPNENPQIPVARPEPK